MSPSEITANYRVNLKITTKDGGKYNLYFYGESEEENGLIIKGNNFYYFKEPLNLLLLSFKTENKCHYIKYN